MGPNSQPYPKQLTALVLYNFVVGVAMGKDSLRPPSCGRWYDNTNLDNPDNTLNNPNKHNPVIVTSTSLIHTTPSTLIVTSTTLMNTTPSTLTIITSTVITSIIRMIITPTTPVIITWGWMVNNLDLACRLVASTGYRCEKGAAGQRLRRGQSNRLFLSLQLGLLRTCACPKHRCQTGLSSLLGDSLGM